MGFFHIEVCDQWVFFFICLFVDLFFFHERISSTIQFDLLPGEEQQHRDFCNMLSKFDFFFSCALHSFSRKFHRFFFFSFFFFSLLKGKHYGVMHR